MMARYLPWIVFTGAVLLSTAASAISLSALGADLPARMEALRRSPMSGVFVEGLLSRR